MYAGDLIDPCKMVSVKMEHGSMTSQAFHKVYGTDLEPSQVDEAVVLEYERLKKDRRFIQRLLLLPDGFLDGIDDGYIRLPLDIDRLILDAQVRFKCGRHAPSKAYENAQKLHPVFIIDRVNGLLLQIMQCWAFDERLLSERRHATKMLRIALRSRLASKRVIEEYKLSKKALDWLCGKIVEYYNLAIVHPGEAVGALAAQSNGEPQQQMTLNTVFVFILFFNLFF